MRRTGTIGRANRDSPRQVVARIQRLCCLGLSSQAIMPRLLREIAALTPSYSREFDWAGPDQDIANAYTDAADGSNVVPLYFSDYHNTKERRYRVTFAEVMRAHYETAVDDFYKRCLKIEWAEFIRSDGYNLILKPLGAHQRLQMKVSERGVGLAVLNLNRLEHEPAFSERERRLLESVAPFVAHAMTPADLEVPLAETEDRGLLIASTDGKLEHASGAARRLLLMATHGQWSPDARWERLPELAAPLVRLCADVRRAFEDQTPAAPPVWFHRNAWGGFEFRAYLLDPDSECPSRSLVGLTVHRYEPSPLRLLERAERLPLSAREVDYIMLAAAGQSRPAIADRMGISLHTAQTHGRNIYAKLGVHSRAELIERMAAA